jgi:predicted porin
MTAVDGFAQQLGGSPIAVYGRLDIGIVNQTNRTGTASSDPGGTLTSVNSNLWQPSLWGVRGSEDIGGGLKIIFNLASTILVDTGQQGNSQRLFDRHAFIGVQSTDWGTLTLGRQVNTLADLFYVTDPLRANNSATNMNVRFGYLGGPGPIIGNGFGASASVPGNTLDRQDNSLKYSITSPSGFVGAAMHAFGESASRQRANSSSGVMLGYDYGGMNLRSAAMQFHDVNGVSFNAWALGGAYKWNNFRFKATATENKIDSSLPAYANLKTQVYSGGVTYSYAKNVDINVAYYRGKRTQDGRADQVANKFYFVPEYFLSKRTILYAVLEHERFNAAGFALATGTPLKTGTRSSSQVAIGISHDF